MADIIKVDPSVLRTKSGEFEQSRMAINNLMEQMNNSVNTIRQGWEGDASDSYQSSYNKLKPDIEKMDRILASQVKNLNQIADVFDKAEASAVAASQGLPSSAID